jgi:hypothetical protein
MRCRPIERIELEEPLPYALIFCLLAAFPARDLAAADGDLKVVSVDPYTNGTSHHSTEVEPDTWARGRPRA